MAFAGSVSEYIQALIAAPIMKDQVVYHQILPESPPTYESPEIPFCESITNILSNTGITQLYRHQAQALNLIRKKNHVVVATPTASGKTLIYTIPVLENFLKNPKSTSLYLFPLKALAQDQLRILEGYVTSSNIQLTSAIYDGDTSAWNRKKIRESPPNVLLTNPEMLHLALLPYHEKWAGFFANLDVVVIDEVHTLRGIMGSHMAQVFKRLGRICRRYGAFPTYIFSSATVSNPQELTEQLTGLSVQPITETGAPQGKKHLIFINPIESSVHCAILLLKAAMHRKLRTIVYTQSRKLTELLALWASGTGELSKKISAYRAGFLPEERREIESKLANGDLLAVISTSALELGIDIGDLDLCILVGYPGTVVATWQRAGRVGRSGQEAAIILIAGQDALDQYFMRNPNEFLNREAESAVINPFNQDIVKKHLLCAASEIPIRIDEPWLSFPEVKKAVLTLESFGQLLKSHDGTEWYCARNQPHRDIDLRGTGCQYTIINTITNKTMGVIDGYRAFRETHPGAIYLHNSQTYRIDHLDIEAQIVRATPLKADYYTKVRGYKETEILEVYEQKNVWGTNIFTGRLKVMDQVTGYEKWLIHSSKRLNIIPLDLPPQIFETDGLWFLIPHTIQKETERMQYHFMGGIHAIEHAAIGIFPLLVMTDRNDVGGISTTFHPQTRCPAIFIYDGIPGGAGISREAFKRAEQLMEHTLTAIQTCTCESGCPSCVHSPKCGSGNRPIDKAASLIILMQLQASVPIEAKHIPIILSSKNDSSLSPIQIRHLPETQVSTIPHDLTENLDTRDPQAIPFHFCVFDLETQRSHQEVGGWGRADQMRISCGVLYDSIDDRFYEYLEDQIPTMIDHLKKFHLVIGFNIKRFDYLVLKGYSNFPFAKLPTLDLLEEVYNRLGYRLSLDHLAKHTLGVQKSGNGLQALIWWKQGKIREIVEYCKRDVEITKDLFLFGRKNAYLLFKNKAGNTVRVPVSW